MAVANPIFAPAPARGAHWSQRLWGIEDVTFPTAAAAILVGGAGVSAIGATAAVSCRTSETVGFTDASLPPVHPNRTAAPPVDPLPHMDSHLLYLTNAMTNAYDSPGSRPALNQRGTSLIEVIVTTGIIGLLLGGTVLGLKSTYSDLGSSSQGFASDVRQARMEAVTRGFHFRIAWTGKSYKTQQLQDNDGNGVWQTDTTVLAKTRQMPKGITMATSSGGAAVQNVEFDTRGMVVTPVNGTAQVVKVGVKGAKKGGRVNGTMDIEIWPSGQVYLLPRAVAQ